MNKHKQVAKLVILSTLLFSFSSAWASANVVFQLADTQVVLDKSTVASASIEKPKADLGNAKIYKVDIALKKSTTDILNKVTRENIGKEANIIVDGKIVSIATIQGELGSDFVVAGLSKEEAQQFLHNLALTQ